MKKLLVVLFAVSLAGCISMRETRTIQTSSAEGWSCVGQPELLSFSAWTNTWKVKCPTTGVVYECQISYDASASNASKNSEADFQGKKVVRCVRD